MLLREEVAMGSDDDTRSITDPLIGTAGEGVEVFDWKRQLVHFQFAESGHPGHSSSPRVGGFEGVEG